MSGRPQPERFLADWRLIVVGPPFGGGSAGIVLPVARDDGTPAVLKLFDPRDPVVRDEHAALRAYDGDGAVRLLDAEPAAGAMLLERLCPGTALAGHSDEAERIAIVCRLLRRLWRLPPLEPAFPTASDLLAGWSRGIPARYETAGRPFEHALIATSLDACAALARPDGPLVLANRDVHCDNVLSAEREPWLLIDPQPVVAERAFDTGYLVQDLLPDAPSARAGRRVVDRLAGELHLDRERIAQWTLVRAVDNTLDALMDGDPWAQHNLAIARLMAGTACT